MMKYESYEHFLESKRHRGADNGISPTFLPDCLFDYQKHVASYAIKKGRAAVFLDTGLGKTLIEIVTAQNYVSHTNRPVLILTPLAVAFQFVREAEKFDLPKIEYSKTGKFSSQIVVSNYERLSNFSPDQFGAVILDESSILKNFDGKIKAEITAFLRKVKYRFLFTATPSPNDFVELGTSSEALGYMGYTDMLTKFFKNPEDTIKPQNIGSKWLLKPHAKKAFFEWVASWSISMRKPSDFGFSDEKHNLPKLIITDHEVKNPNDRVLANGQVLMFNVGIKRLSDIKAEERQTTESRCMRAVEIANTRTGKDFSIYWVNYDREADFIGSMDPASTQISGKMTLSKKEDILKDFADGNIERLITKAQITGFGLNWQHCNHNIVFPSFSYEQYYQLIRRTWRFGQKRDVYVDRIVSNGSRRILEAIEQKAQKSNELYETLNSATKGIELKKDQPTQQITTPKFLL